MSNKASTDYGAWIKDWSRAPQKDILPGDLYPLLQKLLVQYPKNPQALKQIGLSFFLTPFLKSKNQKKFKMVLRKYRKDYYKHVKFNNVTQSTFREDIPRHMKSISIFQKNPDSHFYRAPNIHKVEFKSRFLKIAEVSLHGFTSPLILQALRKVTSLQSLMIDAPPLLPLIQYKRILFASQFQLQNLVLNGKLSDQFTNQTLNELLRLAAQLPSLKSLKFDATCPVDFDVNDIPFDILEERNISYDLRVSHSVRGAITDRTLSLLANLEYLGICTAFTISSSELDPRLAEEITSAQKKAKRLLFLRLSERRTFGLTLLMKKLSKIKTLDLILSSESKVTLSWVNLKDLVSLEKLFIVLDDCKTQFSDLFKNLAAQAKKHQSLKVLVLRLFYNVMTREVNHLFMAPFFKACGKSLKKVFLQYENSFFSYRTMNDFVSCLTLLENLSSVFIQFNEHKKYLNPIKPEDILTKPLFEWLTKQDQMEEVSLLLNLKMHSEQLKELKYFQLPSNLKKLNVIIWDNLTVAQTKSLLKNITKLEHLVLEAGSLNQADFQSLLKVLGKAVNLKTLQIQQPLSMNESMLDFKEFSKHMPNLKLLTVEAASFVYLKGGWQRLLKNRR